MDLLLKMDYEKRAKHLRKKIPKNTVKGKEFSQPVRAANNNFEKGFEKTVNKVNHESRLFHLKYSRKCDNLQEFKKGIAMKSLHFSENTFKESNTDEENQCPNTNVSWLQRSLTENVLISLTPNSDIVKSKSLKSEKISQKTDSSLKAKNSSLVSTPRVRSATQSLHDSQGVKTSWKRLRGPNEKNLNRDSRSYRKLRERFTAEHNASPDDRLQRIILCYEEELQRSSDLKQMVKKLCDDIQTLS